MVLGKRTAIRAQSRRFWFLLNLRELVPLRKPWWHDRVIDLFGGTTKLVAWGGLSIVAEVGII